MRNKRKKHQPCIKRWMTKLPMSQLTLTKANEASNNKHNNSHHFTNCEDNLHTRGPFYTCNIHEHDDSWNETREI